MPSHIRLFFWFTVAVVAIWTIRAALFWIPAAPYLSGLSRGYVYTAIEETIFGTLPLCVATFALAWMAAFHHYNWARWAFVGLFLFREVVLFGNVKLHLLISSYEYLRRHLTNPGQFLVTVLLLAASIFVFTGNARDWFKVSARSRL